MRYTVTENRALTNNAYRMTLVGDTRTLTHPGQFVQVQVPGFYLRRPLSVYDWRAAEAGSMTLVYKALSHGTEALAALPVGAEADVLPGLGNGFMPELPAAARAKAPLLVGGGIGTPPLYGLCKALLKLGQTPTVVLGFGCAGEVILQQEFLALGVPVQVTTADGSVGTQGFVTDAPVARSGGFDYVYTCGPEAMLKVVYALCDRHGADGQFSFEERMACGFGACMGCSCRTKYGSKRICKEGPVLVKEEILW